MKAPIRVLTLVTAFALLAASCSGSSDFEADDVNVTEAANKAPGWVIDGLRIARATLDGEDIEVAASKTTGSTGKTAVALPREDVVAGLLSAGLTEDQANCIYNGITSSPKLTDDVVSLLGLGSIDGAELLLGGAGTSEDVAAAPTIDQSSATGILVAVAPCVDIEVLLGLFGSVAGTNADGSIDLSSVDLASLDLPEGMDLATITALSSSLGAGGGSNADAAAALASVITPEQVQAIQAAIASTIQTQGFDPAALAGLDINNLDLTQVSNDQLGLILAAVVSGLTPNQQNQLAAVAKSDFSDFGLQIDPSTLSPEDLGGLILLLSPILTASISPTAGTPPPGVDPSQIYIPDGVTLANINPLSFVPREDVVAAFQQDGVSPKFAGCFYDHLRNLSTDALAGIFRNSGGNTAGAELLLITIQCIIAP